jgi:hypothetical protein
MGRYVSGDWDWKFAFGDQSSSFGEVMDKICSGLDSVYFSRYVGTQGEGEKTELYIEDEDAMKDFVKAAREFIGPGFAPKTSEEMERWSTMNARFEDEYWDKLMIWKLLKDDVISPGDNFYFHVEY